MGLFYNKGVVKIQLSERQEKIVEIVKENQPIASVNIAKKLELTRATIRPDLSILTMSGILDARPKVGYFYTGKTTFNFISEKIQSINVDSRKSIPIIVDEETTIYDSIVTMFLEDTGTIFISTDGYLSGVVSRKDFLKNVLGGMNLNKTPVGVIMTRMPNIIVTYPEESILDAAIKLIEHEIDSLPVVKEEILDNDEKAYKLVGRVTKTTITQLFVELGDNE